MATIGILIETEDGIVKDTNFGVLTAAREQGEGTIVALMLDGSADGAKEVLGKYGAHKVVQVSVAGGDLSTSPDLKARALAAAIDNYSLDALLGLASAQGRDIFARLAASMDLPLASDCMAVDVAAKTVKKSHFSGKTYATVRDVRPGGAVRPSSQCHRCGGSAVGRRRGVLCGARRGSGSGQGGGR